MLISIVVPVFGGHALAELVDGVEAVFAGRPDEDYEIVLVDDGSPQPETWPRIERLAHERRAVRGVQLTRNFGQNAATLCGLAEARGQFVVTMDDDFQHDPAELPALLARRDAADLVLAQFERLQQGAWRRAAHHVRGLLDRRIVRRPGGLELSAYRVLSRALVDAVVATRPARPMLPALLFHMTRSAVGVPVSHGRRREGRSGYTPWRLLRLTADLVLGNSNCAGRALGLLGALAALASLTWLAWVAPFSGGRALEWHAVGAVVALVGGLQLVALAALGEQLLRALWAVEGRPTYVVRRRV